MANKMCFDSDLHSFKIKLEDLYDEVDQYLKCTYDDSFKEGYDLGQQELAKDIKQLIFVDGTGISSDNAYSRLASIANYLNNEIIK